MIVPPDSLLVDALGAPLRPEPVGTFSDAPAGPPITLDTIREAMAQLPPRPRFDHVRVSPLLPARGADGRERHYWLDAENRTLWLSEEARVALAAVQESK